MIDMLSVVANFFKGVAVGLANVIPGVSGGTMLLILGIYERVIKAMRNIDSAAVKSVFRGWKGMVETFKRLDGLFVGTLALGALVAIWATAKLMVYLLNQQHDPTYGFFFGLVLVSVVVPYKMIRNKGAGTVVACVLGIAAVVGLTVALSGEQQLEAKKKKAAIQLAKVAKQEAAAAKAGQTQTETKAPAKNALPRDGRTITLFLAGGAVAVAAMILPGISGSFMLLLMGIYFDLMMAIGAWRDNLMMLGIFALGCMLGLLVFTRILNYLLERHHDSTLAFLLGLVIGSLYAIWPFKKFAMVQTKNGLERVDLAHTLPASFGTNEIMTLAAIVAGCALVGFFVWLEGRHPRPPEPAEQ